jgi:predicted regulator of Ras-like GTPase activity (Roadblock/LC7/MglB family)
MANFPQLNEEDFQQFTGLLSELLTRSEASCALLVEKAGHLIHQSGDTSSFVPDVMATLASNSFNAVQFMAGLMGESNFPGLYQQGEKFSTLMLNVDDHCILVIIFRAELSVGAVKYFAVETARGMADQIKAAENRAPGVGFDLTDLDVTSAAELFKKK